MRISDWSSDVCSSDLLLQRRVRIKAVRVEDVHVVDAHAPEALVEAGEYVFARTAALAVGAGPHVPADRKRVVEGKGVSVRVDLGGRRSIKKKNTTSRKDDTRERHYVDVTKYTQ